MKRTNVEAIDRIIEDMEKDEKVLNEHEVNLEEIQKLRDLVKSEKDAPAKANPAYPRRS